MAKINDNPEKKRLSKGKLRFRRFCAFLIILIFIWWFNNFTIKIDNSKIYSYKIDNTIKIAVISDLHASSFGISNRKILRKIEKEDPDIVVELGDMYTYGSSKKLMKKPVELTEKIIDAGYPVYFVSGEHDTDQWYIDEMSSVGAHVMNYKSEAVEINGNKVRLLGIDNAYYSPTFDLTNEFTLDKSCYNILLAHIPNYEKFAKFGADLTLCADTHGGMIQLPFDMGPVYDQGTWLPQLTQDQNVYDKGLFEYKGGAMFITSGIGNYPVPARFNNRPEVAIIEIKKGTE